MQAIRARATTSSMNAGERIAEGSPDAVLGDHRVILAYLGDDDASA
jgi:ABC-type branched-subunit amino acid transport system ATPase component